MSTMTIPHPELKDSSLIIDFMVVNGDLKLFNVTSIHTERPGRQTIPTHSECIAAYADHIETSIREGFDFVYGSADEVEVE